MRCLKWMWTKEDERGCHAAFKIGHRLVRLALAQRSMRRCKHDVGDEGQKEYDLHIEHRCLKDGLGD